MHVLAPVLECLGDALALGELGCDACLKVEDRHAPSPMNGARQPLPKSPRGTVDISGRGPGDPVFRCLKYAATTCSSLFGLR